MRKGIIPDYVPEGQEHLYPALRDKNGRPSDYFADPEEEKAKAEYEALTEKPKRGAKSDA